jgi:hypothetical protein
VIGRQASQAYPYPGVIPGGLKWNIGIFRTLKFILKAEKVKFDSIYHFLTLKKLRKRE